MQKTSILVVDDNELDRTVAKHMLASEQFELEFAADGEEGLATCQSLVPHLVLTDVVMPKMTGLEMLTRIRESHPEIPVIVMTSTGNEDVAVEAMQKGAASYTTKPLDQQKLIDIVHQALELSRSGGDYSRLLQHMDVSRYQYNLGSDYSLILPMVEFVQQLAFNMQICEGAGRRQIGLAIEEALINAIFHGNLDLPFDLRQAARASIHQGQQVALAEQRLEDTKYNHRNVVVDITVTPDDLQIIINHDGNGIDYEGIKSDLSSDENEDMRRGLLLIESVMDGTSHDQSGNRQTLMKTRSYY